ncbi:poly-gamma-glutamate biosynthesis protein PgsC/CapC [Corynebacterium bovis]|uniref:poly-gamma-glutamate biosynthesis protein PgsC/CapC n=1 Tax=Corynebacterium bovis TaxID=36808 RepID=UPI00313A3228
MTYQHMGTYGFLTDYIHLSFLVGILLGYLYFRRRQISVGGSLAVGYLASALYMVTNVAVTVAVSLIGYVIIRFVVLKLFLPRPRQIFAIGLAVGVICGGLWLIAAHMIFPDAMETHGLALIGVIVPGMLCNSFIKQGLGRTLVPLAVMIPLSAALGLALTLLTSTVLPWSLATTIFTPEAEPLPLLFGMSAASVLFAVLIQEGTVTGLKLRTCGYVTAGMVVVGATNAATLVVLALAAVLLAAVYVPYSRVVPLFGKDRFVVLSLVSFVVVTLLELVAASVFGVRLGGPQNVVFCVLPAIIVNDVVQYGLRRTATGFGLSAAGCAAIATPALMLT